MQLSPSVTADNVNADCDDCDGGGLDPCLANVSNLVRPLVNLPACAPTPPTISHTHISTLSKHLISKEREEKGDNRNYINATSEHLKFHGSDVGWLLIHANSFSKSHIFCFSRLVFAVWHLCTLLYLPFSGVQTSAHLLLLQDHRIISNQNIDSINT